MINPTVEEAVAALYLRDTEQAACGPEEAAPAALAEAETLGLVRRPGPEFVLTEAGRQLGCDLVRRQRLAERLLTDVLGAGSTYLQEDACLFEHVLQHGLADRICVLLGHPATCPHGKPIPRGPCCAEAQADAIREVGALCDGGDGASGVVAYLSARDQREVQKIMAMGVLPGTAIRVIQSFPSYVFQIGYSQFAVDRQLAEAIHVRWTT
jgi:DtxR family Mn-dependent transcriptional regulator